MRKSPMERAAALIKLAAVKIGALAKLAARWPQEEGAGEQQVVVCERVAINLRSVQSMAAQLSTDVELLQAFGFLSQSGSLRSQRASPRETSSRSRRPSSTS